jgi:acid phosphatase class B
VGKLKKVIYELISKLWEEEIIPHEWKYGIICPIQKRGDEMICNNNNRAVTLLGTTYKILANILHVKLVTYAQEIIEY